LICPAAIGMVTKRIKRKRIQVAKENDPQLVGYIMVVEKDIMFDIINCYL